jgi:hypothetical protein
MITPRNVRHPLLTPIFADSVWFQADPQVFDEPATNLYVGFVYSDVRMDIFTIARHGSRPASDASRNFDISGRLPGMIDIALYDGHVEKVPLENLWNYCWTANWQIPHPRPGR